MNDIPVIIALGIAVLAVLYMAYNSNPLPTRKIRIGKFGMNQIFGNAGAITD